MKYYFILTIQYDGYSYSGWAKQLHSKTIQGEVEKALKSIIKNDNFHTISASKTDAMVSAFDQKVWIQMEFLPKLNMFLSAISKALPDDIIALDLYQVDQKFKVRNCVNKIYMYNFSKNKTIHNYRNNYICNKNLDFLKIQEALQIFVGKHNFTNFSGLKKEELKDINPIRSVDSIQCEIAENNMKILFSAKGFIRYQIRSMVGAAIAYANNKCTLEDIKNSLEMSSNKLPFIAPGNGLILVKIEY